MKTAALDGSNMPTTCFMCHEPATTRDHVPGRAFYPEAKDLKPGAPDVRRNLLTVPACAQHNNGQSLDDQYAAYMVVTSLHNNELSREHIAGKVLRAIRRRPHLVETLMGSARPVVIDGNHADAFQVDLARLGSVMQRIARGLFFHRTGRKLLGPLGWISPDMIHIETGFHPGAQHMAAAFDALDRQDPTTVCYEGAIGSPQVFRYELLAARDEGDQRAYVRMTFYEGFRVLVFPERPTPEAE